MDGDNELEHGSLAARGWEASPPEPVPSGPGRAARFPRVLLSAQRLR